jgi:aryl carrier-like protein
MAGKRSSAQMVRLVTRWREWGVAFELRQAASRTGVDVLVLVPQTIRQAAV